MEDIRNMRPTPRYCAYCGSQKITTPYVYDNGKIIYYYCFDCDSSNLIGVVNYSASKQDLNTTVYQYQKD